MKANRSYLFTASTEACSVPNGLAELPLDKIDTRQKKEEERSFLLSTLSSSERLGSIVGKSRPMRDVFMLLFKAAQASSNIVIYGESGTGKELIASTIHELSSRHSGRFVPINCGAVPAGLVESEFFGYKKGAFTGAAADKPGFLDWADGGTLFMDEVAELDLLMQAKLLRAIDGGGYMPVGSQLLKKPDIRIIAATNCFLNEKVLDRTMREDFFYRLHVLPIHLPPLRERKEDIPLLIQRFMGLYNKSNHPARMPEHLVAKMVEYDWPGNVRELQNTIRRYIDFDEISFLNVSSPRRSEASTADMLKINTAECGTDLKSVLRYVEKEYIGRVLRQCDGHRGRTAIKLGINRKTLYEKISQYSLNKVVSST